MPNPTAAMLVIGDEILSGRTRDSNMNHAAMRLTAHGIDLIEARIVPDRHKAIVQAVRDLAGSHDHLLTSGGIGPTHDDITALAVAEAMETPINVRADARAIMAAYYEARGQALNDARLRMARIPDGATLIENPVSAAPGFSLRNVHVMAGVPTIFEAMLAGLLPHLTGGAPLLSRSVTLHKVEGDLADGLAQIAAAHPELSIGSYPWIRDGRHGCAIVLRGTDEAKIAAAMRKVETL